MYNILVKKYHNQYYDNIYLHDVNLKYPHVDDQHMSHLLKRRDYVYDKNFPYRLKGFKNRLLTLLYRAGLILFAIPVVKIMYGLKIEGKKNVKKYKEMTKNKAMISISNHTVFSDFLIISSLRHKVPTIPMWSEGAESRYGMIIRRALDGIVIARDSMIGLAYAYREMREVTTEGKWLHIFPEAAAWPLYPCLKNFKLGAFRLAYEQKLPILPMAVVFREPKRFARIFKKSACASLKVGEPVRPNLELEKDASIKDLLDRCYDSMLSMMGFKSREQNEEIRQKIYDLQANK